MVDIHDYIVYNKLTDGGNGGGLLGFLLLTGITGSGGVLYSSLLLLLACFV